MNPTDNLSRNTEAVADSLSAAIIEREFTSYSCYDGYLNPSDPTMINADDRKQVVDWCYDIVDHCEFPRETVASAMEMVDRFLSIPSNSDDAARMCDEALRDPIKFQLLTVAALYTSIKVHEQVAISSELCSEICSHIYTAEEIEGMERILLSGLSWRCHAPTAHQVGLSILSLLLPYVDIPEETWGFLMDEMKYLTELAVRDYYFSTQRASTTALAAVLNSISVSISSIKERWGILQVFFRVITKCFDFEGSEQVTAARRRLQLLASSDTGGDEIMDDERSLTVSVMTLKASNSSSCSFSFSSS